MKKADNKICYRICNDNNGNKEKYLWVGSIMKRENTINNDRRD